MLDGAKCNRAFQLERKSGGMQKKSVSPIDAKGLLVEERVLVEQRQGKLQLKARFFSMRK